MLSEREKLFFSCAETVLPGPGRVRPGRPIFRGAFFFCLCCVAGLGMRAFANEIVVWGNPSVLPPNPGDIVQISAGTGYTLGIARDGSLVDWGSDPGTPPAGLSNLVAVAASYAHSLALRQDGTVAIWGDPDEGWAWG